MSETSQATTTPKRRIVLFILAAIVIFLAFIYVAGTFVLPASIKSSYQSQNCELVIRLNSIYAGMYPSFMADKSLASPVMECAVYTLALLNEGKAAWHDSQVAFQVYSETYPNGLFVTEAHEHGAIVLSGLAKEQTTQKEYAEALESLDLILKDYGDTSVAAEAAGLIMEVYTAWGTDLRKAGDFEGAEQVFNQFNAWVLGIEATGSVNSVQREFAQTYLDWGLALQSQKQFEAAKAKLDMAVTTDPEQASSSGPASQVKANQPKFYGEWGDYLVEQKDFARAMEQYETVVSFSEKEDQPAAKDAVANGYIQWAAGLSAEEDFLGALKQVGLAKENAATDSMKKTADAAEAETYLAFSKSGGEQAQQAMKDAIRMVCEQRKKPGLPIFGLDRDNVLAGIYGVEAELPANVAATTPGMMHYVACIEATEKTIEFVDFYGYQMFRIKIFWDVSLRAIETGNLIETSRIEGKDPPSLPTEPGAIVAGGKRQQYNGDPPDMVNFADWLLTVMK